MAEKEKELPNKYLDRRVVERYQKKGLVEDKDYQKYLKSLPDLAEKADKVETEFDDEELGPAR